MNSQDKSTPKIGIVIPIYNVAPYLRECLDSVVNQTYGNFCAVLVNDGSTDNSKEIALEYVAKDSRFVLIDKENGGQSSARNMGIAYFNGGMDSSLLDSTNLSQMCNIFRHTERSEVSKAHESQTNNKSMTKGRINKSHKFTQNKKVANDSKIAKMDSSLTAFAQNDESSHLTLYTNKNATNLNPPKIDYIIFLDSDDFWEVDLLEKCVDSVQKHNAQIVWFSWKTFYDGIDNPSVNGGGGNPLGLAFMATHKRAS